MFPSLKGRFQSAARAKPKVAEASFHPSKEGFKGYGAGGSSASCPVSIPQRKVSKRSDIVLERQADHRFHPSKEGFKEPGTSESRARSNGVSIPQRKVSKRDVRAEEGRRGGFPSLKGRFQRGYGRIFRTVEQMFPSLKGRFQRISMLERRAIFGRFPSLKGRFQRSRRSFHGERPFLFPSLKGRFQRR